VSDEAGVRREPIGVGIVVIGTVATPISNASTARPVTPGPVYWLCANGVTPSNALAADLIWNASA
jgi:hypothetical protein